MPGEGAVAKTIAPSTVTAAPVSRQMRGPKRSSAIPSGICIAAKAKKNTLDSRPISAGDMLSSLARLGAITPIELRRNWLTQ